MATDTVSNEPIEPLPVEIYPNVDHLVTEDDTPVDNLFSEKQQRLLTEPLHSSWQGPENGNPFVAMSNVGLFNEARPTALVPDMMLSVEVKLPTDVHAKNHRSYFVWVYGKFPDVVIEVVSNREGGEDTEKFAAYARIGIRFYVILDPDRLLGPDLLRAFRLDGMRFRRMEEPVSFPDIGLGLRIWQGRYEDLDDTWLRWVDAQGVPIPTGREGMEAERQRADAERERADAERQRADAERQRADEEQQRADRLAEQLRQLGVEPPK
jgi:Uma2 family endonuclease